MSKHIINIKTMYILTTNLNLKTQSHLLQVYLGAWVMIETVIEKHV